MRIFAGLLAIFWVISSAFAGDLDDLDLPNPRQPVENIIVGGQPTIEDLEKLAADGVTTIVNLRAPGEFDRFNEAEVAEKLGMTYINIPVYGMKDITPENAERLHQAIEEANGPVLLHCTIGMRAGALLGFEGYMFHDLSENEAKDLAARAHFDHLDESIERAVKSLDK